MLVVIMGMLIYSGLAYVGEKDEDGTMFDSMPTVSSNTVQIPIIETEELAWIQPILVQDKSQGILIG